MLERFKSHITQQFPALLQGNCLLAISGGRDSVVLAHLLQACHVTIAFAHCNFNLRGAESDGDERFVKQLAFKMHKKYHVTHLDTTKTAQERGISTQMAARDLRYDWFNHLKEKYGYDFLLTAHHLDDQLETFLINLSRGSGIDGLTGIPAQNGWINRPLLPFNRDEITRYAQVHSLVWREDSSNASNKYIRNALRNKVLPLLKVALPDLQGNLQQTFEHLKGSKELVSDAVVRFRESEITTDDSRMYIPIEAIKKQTAPAAYLYELLKDHKPHMPDIMALLDAQTGALTYCGKKQILRDRAHLILEDTTAKDAFAPMAISNFNSKTVYCGHSIVLTTLSTENALQYVKNNSSSNNLFLDAAFINHDLVVRQWRQGDKIAPFGMRGTKLVSDLIIDAKIPLIDKEKVVVLEYENKILSVLGIRAGNHFTVSKNTTQLLVIKYTP